MAWAAKTAKVISTIICTFLFILNFRESFNQFRQKKTTVLSDKKTSDRLPLPAVTFCSEAGFKTTNGTKILTMEGFINHSYSFDELFHDPKNFNCTQDFVYEGVETIYSMYRGRCYTYTHQKEVLALEPIRFAPKPDVELIAYIHDPGEEFWLIFFWLPEAPARIDVPRSVAIQDFQLFKESYVEEENCRPDWTAADYLNCFKALIVTTFKEVIKNGTVADCATPWIQTFITEEVGVKRPCSPSEMDQLTTIMRPMLKNGGQYKYSECSAPCTRHKYTVRGEAFNKFSNLQYDQHKGHVPRAFYIFYPQMLVIEYTHKYIMAFNDFISALGGGLGLFMGFSCLSLLFQLIELAPSAVKEFTSK